MITCLMYDSVSEVELYRHSENCKTYDSKAARKQAAVFATMGGGLNEFCSGRDRC